MNLGGQNFTNFQNVRVGGNGQAPGAVRFVANSFEGTLSLSTSAEANHAAKLSAHTGGVGITGTFAVQMPAITSWSETAVTVSGIRREDAVLCQIQDMAGTVTTGRTFPIIAGVRPENGYLYITFYNPTGTATLYAPLVLAYTAFR